MTLLSAVATAAATRQRCSRVLGMTLSAAARGRRRLLQQQQFHSAVVMASITTTLPSQPAAPEYLSAPQQQPCRQVRNLTTTTTTTTAKTTTTTTTARAFSTNKTEDEDDDDDDDEDFSVYDHPAITHDKHGPLHQKYFDLVAFRDVEPDPIQLQALEYLEHLRRELLQTEPPDLASLRGQQQQSSLTDPSQSSSLFSSWFSSSTPAPAKNTPPSKNFTVPKGVYMHGGVGCGKTFLMNLFYDSFDTDDNVKSSKWAKERQKIHFHKFMLNIHQMMHEARYANDSIHQGQSDVILPAVIEKVAQQGRLICLDEFQVTDVGDAMILQRLFTGLWQKGAVVIATSNRPPDDLYLNGIQRDRFLPFIDLLKKECQVVGMWESETDYRLIQKIVSGESPVYFQGKKGFSDFDKLFYQLVNQAAVAPTHVLTQTGRRVAIPQAAMTKRIARFSFEDLCQKALGAADYLMIGQHFHTVFVQNIPTLSINEVNWIRRFITFVDSMYESNVKLILHTQDGDTAIQHILKPDSKESSGVHDEVFAFDRTVSRLQEMASKKYLQKRWTGKTTSSPALSAAAVGDDNKDEINALLEEEDDTDKHPSNEKEEIARYSVDMQASVSDGQDRKKFR